MHVIAAPLDYARRFAGHAVERVTAAISHRREP
jgi:hypothetical protein